MNMYFFGGTSGHLNMRAARIAWRHGAELMNFQEGGRDGYPIKRWCTFACSQQGRPYDQDLAEKVMRDIELAGGVDVLRKNNVLGSAFHSDQSWMVWMTERFSASTW